MISRSLLLFFALVALCLRPAFAQSTFDPANPPTSANPPTEEYWEHTGDWSHQIGPKTFLMIRYQPNDRPWENPPTEASLYTRLGQVSQKYYDASGHRTWAGPKRLGTPASPGVSMPGIHVAPVVTVDKDYAFSSDDENGWVMLSIAINTLRAQGGDYAEGGPLDPFAFDFIMLTSNAKPFASEGYASVGGNVCWPGGAYEHELGHLWGLQHANFLQRPAGSTLARDVDGTSIEYGDGADIMGSGNTLFHVLFKSASLGWLQESRGEVLAITNSGTYRLYSHTQGFSIGNPTTKVRGLRLALPSDAYLGFRFEAAGTVDGGDDRGSRDRNAVQMHWAVNRNFIDTTPDSRLDDDKIDGSIKIGRTYSETIAEYPGHAYGGIHITPIVRGVTTSGNVPAGDHYYIDVVIHRGSDVLGNTAAPTASFASSTVNATVGSPVALSVTASDPDGDALAYDWDFGNGTYNITNDATQSATYAAAGLYRVRCTVSDMKGKTTTVYQWVNVGSQPTYAATSDPSTTGVNYRTYSGTWTTMPDFDTLNPVATGTCTGFDLAVKPSNDNFAILYTGFIEVPATDTYQFEITADDGAILKIDGQTVVDNNGDKKSARLKTGSIALAAGKHPFRLEYFHKDGTETLTARWWRIGQGDAAAAIPSASLVQPTWAGNTAPSVAITAPANNAEVLVNSDVILTADATDDGSVAKVAFFANGSFLATDTTAPYTYTWPKVSVGTQTLTAIAYDATGRWTRSSAVTVQVVSPPPTNGIGLNFGATDAIRSVYANEAAGAVYAYPNWNNLTTLTGTAVALNDHNGNTSSATLTFQGNDPNNGSRSGFFASNANTSTANGRLLRGGLYRDSDLENGTEPNPYASVSGIPYATYDVYVYFDGLETWTDDAGAQRYLLTPSEGAAPAARFGRNSLAAGDGIGDFPTYDSWSSFREATATSLTDPADQLAGNYVVFRNQTASSFKLEATRREGATLNRRYFNAIQIIETIPSGPTLLFRHSGAGTSVSEAGTTDVVTVALAFAPTGNVTVTLDPGTQLAVDPATLVFTPANWSEARAVTVRALDDATSEGLQTATITATATGANYTGLPPRTLPVQVTDNDQPTVSLFASGQPLEGTPPSPGTFRFTRSGTSDLVSPVTVAFSMSGTADKAADYTLSGGSVSYNSTTGNGTVIIPAGSASVELTLTPVTDAVSEGSESVTLTLPTQSGVTLDASPSASLTINENKVFFAQYYGITYPDYGIDEAIIDLDNTTITLTPDGSASHYRGTITRGVTTYPTDPSSHTDLHGVAKTYADADQDGYWKLDWPATFYGVSYPSIYVRNNAAVSFDLPVVVPRAELGDLDLRSGSGTSSLSLEEFFAARQIALYRLNIHPTNGKILAGRITTPGHERSVITYDAVTQRYQTGKGLRAQLELWDDGRITLTFLGGHAANDLRQTTGLSNSALNGLDQVPAGFQETNLSALPETRAPVFATVPTVSATTGAAYSYAMVASDPDGSVPAITAVTKPAWLTFTDNGNGTATLSGTPSTAGSATITLRASDGVLSSDQTYTLAIAPVGGNTAPAFTSTPVTTANAGESYSATVTVTDPNGQPLALSASTLPGWLSFADNGNGTATLSGTAPTADLADYSVVLLASDGIASSAQSFTVTVNQRPVLTLDAPSLGSAVVADRSNPLLLAASASDDGLPASPGALSAAWTKISGPGTVTFADASALDTSVTFSQAGIYRLRLTVNDGAISTTKDVVAYVETDAIAALSNGLIGHWKFDEASGTTAADSSGSGNALTLNGSVTFSSGMEGNAYTGSATDGQFGEKAALVQPAQLTFSAWVNPATAPADGNSFRTLLAFRQGTNTRAYLAVPNGSRQLQFRSSHSTQGVWNVTNYNLPANEWVHVVLSYDQSSTANNPTVYINGQSVTVVRSTAPSGTINTTDATRIGGTSTNTNQSWKGLLDDVRLYNRILTAEEAALLPLTSTPNTAPVVTAALQDPLLTGQNTAMLFGTATDDGLPASPGAVSTTWTQISGPPTATIDSPNELQSPVTFPATGTYAFRFTATDGELTTTAEFSVNAQLEDPVATTLEVTPASVTVLPSGTTAFSATVRDQYGQAMSGQTINWSVSGGGSINSAGLFTAFASEGGPFTVTATSGSLSDTAEVTVFNNPPTISDLADQVVTQNVATGVLAFTIGDTETAASSLSVTATSSNQTLVPDGNIALGGSGANRTVQATPATNQSGTATITVTVSDGVKSASDTWVLTVQAGVVTSIDVTPATATLQPNGTRQFSATVKDQTGVAMNPQPTVTWSATGAGTVNSSGLFTAGGSNGSATVTATVNSISGNATVTVTNTAPTVTITSPSAAALALPDRTDSLVLTANATDAQVTPTVTWSQVSGPAGQNATFANANSANTSVSFSADGSYVLRITASDGLLTATDEVTVNAGASGGLGPVSAYLSANFSTGVTNGNPDSLRFSGDNADKSIAFTGGGNNAASPMWTVANSAKVDFKAVNSVTLNGFTWGQSSDPIRYGSVFTTGTDFGFVIGASNSGIRYSGTAATQPLVQFGAGAPASGAFNFVFEVKGTEPLGNLTVKYKAGTASTSGVWNGGVTAAENGNYNVSVHPLDASGNAGTGFTFYASNQALGAGQGVSVTAADQGSNSLAPGTYLLRVLFFDKTKVERYSIDDLSIEAATGLPAGPQVNPGTAPAAQTGTAATLNGTASAAATWSLVSGPVGGTATFANANSANTTVTLSAAGAYVLRLSATADGTTVFQDLSVTATSSNTAPTIGTISAQTIPANGSTGALAFTIDDAQTAATSLTVTATSSNTTLVPNGNLTLGGSGANRTLTVTPAANQTGSTTITLTVSDGTLTANSTFTVTVTETMASWISTQSGVGTLTAATDDPDGDGLANLLEYALGTAPGNAASASLPILQVSGLSPQPSYLTLTFTPSRVTGLTYTMQSSNDLVTWSDTTLTGLTPGTPFTHTDSIANPTRRFLRLRVSEP